MLQAFDHCTKQLRSNSASMHPVIDKNPRQMRQNSFVFSLRMRNCGGFWRRRHPAYRAQCHNCSATQLVCINRLMLILADGNEARVAEQIAVSTEPGPVD